MAPAAKLGGFKVLQDAVWIRAVQTGSKEHFPAQLCRAVALEKVNLLFITCGCEGSTWCLDLVVPDHSAEKVSQLLENHFNETRFTTAPSAILSVFPHRTDPLITGELLEAFGREDVHPWAMAHSNAAVSAVLRRDLVHKATGALFGSFHFSAYRTPADWKLAQKGKETLYREVVASYQEKKPKVYGLEWRERQAFLNVKLASGDLGRMGTAFKTFGHLGLDLSFFVTSPSKEEGQTNLFFCLPESDKGPYDHMILSRVPGATARTVSPSAFFSMNGPHFGDRYGVISDFLTAFDLQGIQLLAMGCAVASITGVVPADQMETATCAIRTCFEVPSVTKRP
jgi:aspartokinase